MKEFTKLMPNSWDLIDDNNKESIVNQIWIALPFTWQSPIMKYLNLSGMLSPPCVTFESMYAILNICDMRLIVSIMLMIDLRGIPICCKAKLAAEWKIMS